MLTWLAEAYTVETFYNMISLVHEIWLSYSRIVIKWYDLGYILRDHIAQMLLERKFYLTVKVCGWYFLVTGNLARDTA